MPTKHNAAIALIGTGLVGTELVTQLAAQAKTLTSLKLVGVTSSSKMVLNSDNLLVQPVQSLVDQLKGPSAAPVDLEALADHLLKQANKDSKQKAILVDCTASSTIAELYPGWLKRGINIVTPNKKAFSSSIDLFREIEALQSTAVCLHEGTVGAGLPVLNTLSDLLLTGDQVVRIEGILSGTLSYLFNTFSTPGSKAKFSDLVKDARAKGYTEPDPRDDLNGVDFARKVVILGRTIGLDLDLSTLPIDNIVPEPLRAVASVDDFLARLPEYDDYFDNLRNEAVAQQQVLRYVGVVDAKGSSVKLSRYPATHPFASLTGSTNVVAFTTLRYPNPLIVQGAGAGAAVTAMGVFGDILKVAS